VYRGVDDIPAEYRIFGGNAEREPLVSVENAELSPLLLKMHALAGSYMDCAQDSLDILTNSQSSDFLLLSNSRYMVILDAAPVYRIGSPERRDWTIVSGYGDLTVYAVAVTGRENGRMFGDITEVSFDERLRDIEQNSVWATHLEMESKSGTKTLIPVAKWDTLDRLSGNMPQNAVHHYAPADLSAITAYLADLRAADATNAVPVAPEVLLTKLNERYMSEAAYPQSDMLRVAPEVAREVLARGDAKVYTLDSDRPKRLLPFDAILGNVKGVVGIKRDDMSGFDKWAERKSAAILQKQKQKTKNIGENTL
jgi:hypothetical protein